MQVLIVEDHSLLRGLFTEVVKTCFDKVEIIECDSVSAARGRIGTAQPDLVVLDWILPDGTGEAVLRKAAEAGCTTRWLVVSGYRDVLILRAALELGAHGFLLKYSPLTAMREALQRVAKGGTYFCPETSTLMARSIRERGRGNEELTRRESQVLRLYARGLPPKAIAAELGVAVKTIHNQLHGIRQKFGVTEPAALIRLAMDRGLN